MLAWSFVKMTEICQCPFVGGHEKYDVDLATQLEVDIWSASVTLKSSAKKQE